jgi:hypothetical protein
MLLHDLREGRTMQWAVPMKGEEKRGVDIFSQVQETLAKAREDYSAR